MKTISKLYRVGINPLPDDKNLDWSELKQSADDNFEVDVNSRKFSKLVENTVEKREIARYEQFLLFPQCFQKACFPGASKGVIVWEWVNPLPDDKILDWSKSKAFADDKSNETKMIISVFDRVENIVGKEKLLVTSNFSLSDSVFKRLVSQGRQKVFLVWEWVKSLP